MQPIFRHHTVHLCVDMQRLFAEDTEWRTTWAYKILPQVAALCEHAPDQTVFTRFIPFLSGEGHGMWKAYYERWPNMTLDELDPILLDLVPELAKFCPPATVIDKHVYAPWIETALHQHLQSRHINTLIVSGGEIDICVIATVFGAVDYGYRVIVAKDALCSSDDETYDSIMTIFKKRFSIQIECEDTETILSHWT